MYKIAILITTFLRDKLLYSTLQSIVDYYTEDCIIFVADQGYTNSEKDIQIDYFKSQIPLEYYHIPFDSGLSYARNFLVQKAIDMNIPYCLLSADSIQFMIKNDFSKAIEFLESDEKNGILGFGLFNSKCGWEYLMKVIPQGIQLEFPIEKSTFKNMNITKVDICRNIFLAKTKTLINLWDKEMKLLEHELAFLEYKKRNYNVHWTDFYQFRRITIHNNNEYMDYRNRIKEFKQILQQKLNINGWVIYPKLK